MILHGPATLLLPFASQVSLCLTDPPYSAEVHDKATSAGTGGFSPTGKGVRRRDFGFARLGYALRRTVAQFASASQGWTLVYTDIESINRWRITAQACGTEYIRTLPWVRWSQPQLSGDRPPQGWEAVVILHAMNGRKPKAKSWNGYGELVSLGHEPLVHKCLRGSEKFKAEKPLDQALDLVSWFSSPGDLVADLCVGSGTTARACQILGRRFVGTEIDAETHARATGRLASPLSDSERERVQRFVDRVHTERPVDAKFPPAVRRQEVRQVDARTAKACL